MVFTTLLILSSYNSLLQTVPHQEHICGRFLRRIYGNLHPKEVLLFASENYLSASNARCLTRSVRFW